jgi:hypothetical protein
MMTLSNTIPASNTRYELPPGGISLLGYVVRRMHKTALLLPVSEMIADGHFAEALAQVALYAVAASASFGPAYYQPEFNGVGEKVSEADPATQARVSARFEARSPHYRISYSVELLDGSRFTGTEEITGTTVGLHGLGMPAPSRFNFTTATGDYTAQMLGIITSELLPGLLTTSRIRAHGTLHLNDRAGDSGTLRLTRQGDVHIVVTPPGGVVAVRREQLARVDR